MGEIKTTTMAEETQKPKPRVKKITATENVDVTEEPMDAGAFKKRGRKPRIALFIDVENACVSRENLLELLFLANAKYKIELCKLYGCDTVSLPAISEVAAEYNLTTLGRMAYKSGSRLCLDSRVLLDAYECAVTNKETIDTIFVWAYPCDLNYLFEKITALGIATATIDHPAFDCKNKFVSQALKIYSPYRFKMDKNSYAQLKSREITEQPASVAQPEGQIAPENIAPKIEPNILLRPEPQPNISEIVPAVPPVAKPKTEVNLPKATPAPALQPEPFVMPQPTPTIVSVPTEAPQAAPVANEPIHQNIETVNTTQPTGEQKVQMPEIDSLDGAPIPVLPKREIAERGHPLPHKDSTESLPEAAKPEPTASVEENGVSILDMMKQAGLIDDLDGNNQPKKYEDTIGDL